MVRPLSFGILLLGLLSTPLCAAEASTERLVRFPGVDGATLAGTLLLPAGDADYPALLILAGSGPCDRNGNQPPGFITDVLKQFAEGLAEKGIASLRFDKRGMHANAAEMPKTNAELADFSTWDHFAGDAAAGYRFLREQKRIDPNRVGILGHSEGGLIALDIARRLKTEGHPPVVLVLVGCGGRVFDVILGEQLRGMAMAQGATPQQADEFMEGYNRVIRTIRETGKIPADVPPGIQIFFPRYLSKMWKSEIELDPCKLAAEYSGPVLIMNGGADVQVSAERDAKALDAAFAARKGDDHVLAIIPNASHNMKVLANPQDPGIAGRVAPAAMERLEKWAVEHLGKK